MDFFQGRALLLSLTELSGPRLESGFFVTSDSPGLLVLFWDLSVHLPESLCSTGGAILVTSSANSDGRLLLFCCYFDLAPCPALLATASEDLPSFRVEVSYATASVSGLLLTMSGTQV